MKNYCGSGVVFWKKENGKIFVLLQKRSANMKVAAGMWSTFGGAREADETAIEAAMREACEETGQKVFGRQAILDFFTKDGSFNFHTEPLRVTNLPGYEFATYQCEVLGDKATSKWYSKDVAGEVEDIAWFATDSLPENTFVIALRYIREVVKKNS